MGGKRIRVIRGNLADIGKIVCFYRPEEGLLGVRIDITRPPVRDYKPAPKDQWVTDGTITVEYLCLGPDQIDKISESQDTDADYCLTI